jgi:hypothetical protein
VTSQNVRDTDVTGVSLVSLSGTGQTSTPVAGSTRGGSESPAMASHDSTRLLVDVREAAVS